MLTFAFCANAQDTAPSANMTYEDAKKLLPLPYPKATNALRIRTWEVEAKSGLVYSLATFLGKNAGTYIDLIRLFDTNEESISLFNQFTEALTVSNGAYRLPSGNLLYWGVQPKELNNHGLIVTLGNSTQILATALLHQNCGKNNDIKSNEKVRLPYCDESPTLKIFYSTKFGPSVEINEQITKLVQRHIEINNRAMPRYRSLLRV